MLLPEMPAAASGAAANEGATPDGESKPLLRAAATTRIVAGGVHEAR